VAPLKTQSLRCFQMVQAPKMIREFKPLFTSPLTIKTVLSHQTSKEESEGVGQELPDQNCAR